MLFAPQTIPLPRACYASFEISRRFSLGRGAVEDYARVNYLKAHLRGVQRAVDEGYPMKGYFAWSLLDNFEWAFGYDRRFGIIHVDYETQKRTPKASAEWYARLIAKQPRE